MSSGTTWASVTASGNSFSVESIACDGVDEPRRRVLPADDRLDDPDLADRGGQLLGGRGVNVPCGVAPGRGWISARALDRVDWGIRRRSHVVVVGVANVTMKDPPFSSEDGSVGNRDRPSGHARLPAAFQVSAYRRRPRTPGSGTIYKDVDRNDKRTAEKWKAQVRVQAEDTYKEWGISRRKYRGMASS